MEEQKKEENLDLEKRSDENKTEEESEILEKNKSVEENEVSEENEDETTQIAEASEETEEEEEEEDENAVPPRLRNRLYDHIHIPLKTMDKIIYVTIAAIVILIIYGIIKQ